MFEWKSIITSNIRNSKSKYANLEGLRQARRLSPWLPKTYEVEMSRVLLLLLRILLVIIDFRSYVDAIMSLYSIKYMLLISCQQQKGHVLCHDDLYVGVLQST